MILSGAEMFERSGLKAWPGIEVEWDGAWVRRAANGYTKRANSVQSLDPGDDSDAEARIAASVAWFKARGLPPVFRVTPLTSLRVIAVLDDLGWRSFDASYQFAMPLGPTQPDPRCRDHAVLDPAYLAAAQRLQNYSQTQMAGLKALLAALEVPARGFVLHDVDGAPVASALMTIADGIVVTGNVVTDPNQRRKGYAAAMLKSGLAWAHAAGAHIAALNVQADNTAAQALYAGLGYTNQYAYSYRAPGAA